MLDDRNAGESDLVDAPFHRTILNRPLSYRALRKLALAVGWVENKSQGKGSHRTFTRKGYREITMPCHSESHEYQRGQTRTFLKQILEPLADVCQLPVQGIHSVEQVETIVAELLDYLPSQVHREYEQAIAEMKAAIEVYRAEQQLEVDHRIQQYEEQKLHDCERAIKELQLEQQSSNRQSNWFGRYILYQSQQLGELETQYQQTLLRLSSAESCSQTQVADLHALEQERNALHKDLKSREILEQQLTQTLQESHDQVACLKRLQTRDRILMWVFLGLSVCLGTVLVHREINNPRSPQSALVHIISSRSSDRFG